jgi:hypothetical protein
MKLMKGILVVLVSLALVGNLISCSKPPQAEIDAAKAAVARAEADVDVGVYAPASLAAAKEALARMEKELDAKQYDATKARALETVAAADKAISDAKENKEKTKSSASSVLNALKNDIVETEKALASAKKTRGAKIDFAAAGTELAAIKTAYASAEKDFNSGSYKTALTNAEAAAARLRALMKQISDAVRATSKKK